MTAYLDRLGALVQRQLEIPRRESSDSSLKLNVLELAETTVRRERFRRNAAAASGAAVLCLCGFTAVYQWKAPTREKAIEYHLAGNSMSAPVGKYVAPLPKQPLALRFSEGSVVELEPGARARVARTTSHGATVLLETGEARVNVVHRPAADWTILAGPYTVHITGTAFNVDFESSTQRFELMMQSGVVSVEGPGLSQPVEVRGDQKFVHYVGDPNFERRASRGQSETSSAAQATVPTTADAVSAREDRSSDAAPLLRKAATSGPESSTNKNSNRSGWAAEVARGEYASVLRRAKEKGWTQVLAEANTADLMAVANAARFLGRTDSSREALEALRRRFKGTYSAQSATYLLGRISEPSSPKEAMSWYQQYEREAPSGALLAEAAGRRLLLVQATGDRSGTERLAREYVSRFPDGPYAGVARKIVLP